MGSNPTASSNNMIHTTFALHGSKDDNWDQAQKLGLSDKAWQTFRSTGYETIFQIEVDPETGEVFATHVNGTPLTERTRI